MLHVFGIHFQKKIIIAGDIITFYNLLDLQNIRYKAVAHFPVMLFKPDIAEHNKALIKLFWVKQRDIFLDITTSFQAFYTLHNWRWGQVYLCSEFLDGMT